MLRNTKRCILKGSTIGALLMMGGIFMNSGCGDTMNGEVTLKEIQVSSNSQIISVGTTTEFKAMGIYVNGSSKDLTIDAKWSSSNEAVARLEKSTAKGLSAGRVKITAEYQGFQGEMELSVSQAMLKSISVKSVKEVGGKLSVGDSLQLKATATFEDGLMQDVTNDVQWKADSSIATVDKSGLLTGKSYGKGTVTATLNTIKDTFAFEVIAATLTEIKITPKTTFDGKLPKGKTLSVSAQGTYKNGKIVELKEKIKWSSSAPTLASLTADEKKATAVITAKAEGNAVISAVVDGVTGTLAVTITPAVAVSLGSDSSGKMTMAVGQSKKYQAIATLSDGTKKEVSTQVAWHSSNDKVATIDEKGRVSTIAVGTAKIDVTWNNLSAETTLDVTEYTDGFSDTDTASGDSTGSDGFSNTATASGDSTGSDGFSDTDTASGDSTGSDGSSDTDTASGDSTGSDGSSDTDTASGDSTGSDGFSDTDTASGDSTGSDGSSDTDTASGDSTGSDGSSDTDTTSGDSTGSDGSSDTE